METYSPALEASVRQQLQAASAQQLRALGTYYLKRRGPGLGLLREECQHRNIPFPQPQLEMADVAT